MKQSRRFFVYASLTFLFLTHTLFYFFALGNDAVDDAYISFRYAQNAIRGYGLVFNPNERVEGFTNFLWTALMVPLEGAHADVGRASMLLGALFALGVLLLVIHFPKVVGEQRTVGWMAALLLAVDGSFALWAVGGLETPMFAFLIFAGALLYLREQQPDVVPLRSSPEKSYAREPREIASSRSFDSAVKDAAPLRKLLAMTQEVPFSGIFFALAAMTRPEGVFVLAITAAHQAGWRLISERRLFTRRDIERLVAFAAIFVPYWLVRWAYYHSFLPNSFHAKVNTTGPAAQIERGWNHLSQFVNVHLGWAIVIPLIATLVLAIRSKRSLPSNGAIKASSFWKSYFASILMLYVAYIVYVGGDWSVGRFFVPLLALFYLLFSTGVVDIFNWLVEKSRARARLILPGQLAWACLAAALWFASSWNGEYGIYIRDFEAGRATLARETMGKWLKLNVPSGTLIAVDAAGQVPYYAELPAVDMFGINDLHIGRLNVDTLGKGTPGHEKFDLTYVILRKPEYVIIYGDLLDSVKEYERAPVNWTTDDALKKFLTLYRRRTK